MTAPGPGSLYWRYAGDRRALLLLGRVGLLELMFPALGAGVVEHSAFYTEPWARTLRSIPRIAGVVYDGPAAGSTAHGIRELHHGITGRDDQGRRYHALDPEVWFWAHATMFDAVLQIAEVFDRPLTEAEREQLYAESVLIYRRYGVSDRPVPGDWAEFHAYFERVCAEQLELTPAARALLAFVQRPETMAQPWLPAPLWRLVAPLVGRVLWFLTRGLSPPVVRAKIGACWRPVDQQRFVRFAAVVARLWPLLPYRLRYLPRARVAFARTKTGRDNRQSWGRRRSVPFADARSRSGG
ncbi:oxygenase MpaB family protein [Crossiella sp. CA198]|uniref:oxygenase MpaB family protein n=1 Tax=Crossiella sp. CA198 TaxID=3455607 RepID=UPI003F8D7CEB